MGRKGNRCSEDEMGHWNIDGKSGTTKDTWQCDGLELED